MKLSVFLLALCYAWACHAQPHAPAYVATGKIHTLPALISKSSPYYKNQPFGLGTIAYDGLEYKNQNLAYDLSSDKLIIENGNYIEVVKTHVSYFTINDDTLIHYTSPPQGLTSGFYEKIFRSPYALAMARHSKYLKEMMRGMVLERFYESSVRYYIVQGETFREIRKEKDLLAVNRNLRKEAKALLRGRSLSFRTHPQQSLQTVLAFYTENATSL